MDSLHQPTQIIRKKFQLIISVSTFILIIIGFIGFSVMSRQYIFNGIKEQVIMDNRVIGEEILNFLYKNIPITDEDKIIQSLQNICDEITLPNNGFICAIQNNGDLVAAPGLKQGQKMNLNVVSMVENRKDGSSAVEVFNPGEHFEGILDFENGQKTNIIASIPIGNMDLRLNVHQDNEAIMQRAKEFIKPMYPIGIISAIIIALLGYIISDRIIKRYENRIEYQNEIISRKNKDMTDSIKYARYLQSAYLPSRTNLEELIPEFFIFQKPKDIVSGDFFWVDQSGGNLYFAAIDCTGHGVPGSLLSMISYGLLEQALHQEKLTEPARILDFIGKRFTQSHLQESSDHRMTDGMDIALCCYNQERKMFQFSGAQRPIFLIQNNEVKKIKGTSVSIGEPTDGDHCFENHEISVHQGDIVYLSSDGFADQFGGPQGKKFMVSRFTDYLNQIHTLPMAKQREELDKTLNEWMGEHDQIDDILVMGVKIW